MKSGLFLGRSQAVRQRILIPPFGGSIPPAPTISLFLFRQAALSSFAQTSCAGPSHPNHFPVFVQTSCPLFFCTDKRPVSFFRSRQRSESRLFPCLDFSWLHSEFCTFTSFCFTSPFSENLSHFIPLKINQTIDLFLRGFMLRYFLQLVLLLVLFQLYFCF